MASLRFVTYRTHWTVWLALLLSSVAFAAENCLVQRVRLALGHPPVRPVQEELARKISPEKLKEIFAHLAEDPEIPFCRIQDGCQARSHAVAWLLEEQGFESRKIFAVSTSDRVNLTVPIDETHTNFVRSWVYHVANVIEESSGASETRSMVIDPALFSEPVSVERWKKRISQYSKGARPEFQTTSRFVYLPKEMDQPPEAWREVDLKWMIAGLKTSQSLASKYQAFRRLYLRSSDLFHSDPEFREAIQDSGFNRWWYEQTPPEDPAREGWRGVWKSLKVKNSN